MPQYLRLLPLANCLLNFHRTGSWKNWGQENMSEYPGPPFFALMRSEAQCQPSDDGAVRNEARITRHGTLDIHVLEQKLLIEQVSHFHT